MSDAPLEQNSTEVSPANPGERTTAIGDRRERGGGADLRKLAFWNWSIRERPSVYTVLLGASVVFMALSCLLMWLEWARIS